MLLGNNLNCFDFFGQSSDYLTRYVGLSSKKVMMGGRTLEKAESIYFVDSAFLAEAFFLFYFSLHLPV